MIEYEIVRDYIVSPAEMMKILEEGKDKKE